MENVSVKEMLKSVGFQKIVVIDDCIYRTMGEIEGFNKCIENVLKNNRKHTVFLSSIKKMNVLEFKKLVSNSKAKEKALLDLIIIDLPNEESSDIYDDKYQDILREFSSDDVCLYEEKEEFIRNINQIDNDTIVFIDVNFNDKNNETFRSIIKTICEDDKQINFVIYSSEEFEVMNYNQTEVKLQEYLEDDFHNIIKDNSWLVYSLSFLSKSSNNFQVDLMKQIRKNYKLKYLLKIKESTNNFINTLEEEFFNIQNTEERRHHFYLTEGMNSSEILEEIIVNKFKKEICKCRNKEVFDKINCCTNVYYEQLDDTTIKENLKKGRFLSEYHTLKNHIERNLLNYSMIDEYLDVRKGDLLKIRKKYYVVLTQDCDMIIRYSSSNTNSVHLVPINITQIEDSIVQYVKNLDEQFTNNKSSEVREKMKIFEHKVNMYDGSLYYVNVESESLDYANEIQVPVDYLNYRLLLNEGNDIIRFSTKKKIEELNKKIDYRNFYDYSLSFCTGNMKANDCVLITRVGNLDSDTVDIVINQWVNHKTRKAFNILPNEF